MLDLVVHGRDVLIEGLDPAVLAFALGAVAGFSQLFSP